MKLIAFLRQFGTIACNNYPTASRLFLVACLFIDLPPTESLFGWQTLLQAA